MFNVYLRYEWIIPFFFLLFLRIIFVYLSFRWCGVIWCVTAPWKAPSWRTNPCSANTPSWWPWGPALLATPRYLVTSRAVPTPTGRQPPYYSSKGWLMNILLVCIQHDRRKCQWYKWLLQFSQINQNYRDIFVSSFIFIKLFFFWIIST